MQNRPEDSESRGPACSWLTAVAISGRAIVIGGGNPSNWARLNFEPHALHARDMGMEAGRVPAIERMCYGTEFVTSRRSLGASRSGLHLPGRGPRVREVEGRPCTRARRIAEPELVVHGGAYAESRRAKTAALEVGKRRASDCVRELDLGTLDESANTEQSAPYRRSETLIELAIREKQEPRGIGLRTVDQKPEAVDGVGRVPKPG